MLSDLIESRIDLQVPYPQKDRAKSLGALWDKERRTWYVPPGISKSHFAEWLPVASQKSAPLSAKAKITDLIKDKDSGCSLSSFLATISAAVSQAVSGAQWIQCEINKLEIRQNGDCFLELAEYDCERHLLAKSAACIWRSHATKLLDKFKETTGGQLQAGMKVLLLCRANFHIRYGLSLIIEDIDPNYTLGDMEAKLNSIRKLLIEEKLYDRNKTLVLPTDFMKLAVIAPENAAGLGDFKKEADKLAKYQLCHFTYYTATFQGALTSGAIKAAIEEVCQAHHKQNFDAVVIIRGGGATTDLAWLNDEGIARSICSCGLPVICGIGHERDSTIIDEVACYRLGTPSKVIQFITQSIVQTAREAIEHINAIKTYGQQVISRQAMQSNHCLSFIESASKNAVKGVQQNLRHLAEENLVRVKARLSHCSLEAKHWYQAIAETAQTTLVQASERTQAYQTLIEDHSQKAYLAISQSIKFDWLKIESISKAILQKYETETRAIFKQIIQQAEQLKENQRQQLDFLHAQVRDRAASQIQLSHSELKSLMALIMGYGPESTLKRGYAVVRNKQDEVIVKQKEALAQSTLTLEFQDGRIAVEVVEQ